MRRLRWLIPLSWWLLSCDLSDPAVCGDGKLDPGEDCDGLRLAQTYLSFSCTLQGYHAGEAVCTDDCRYDLSPCLEAGRCGDGVLDEAHEECDPARPVACALVGHPSNQGTALCSHDCKLDLTPCARCGDGVLQPGEGELVELDLETCRALGFFGGVFTTEDCRTGSTAYCGNYLLIPGETDLRAPVVAGVGGDELWVAGQVTGSFDGKRDPGCAVLVEHYEMDDEYPGTLVGYEWTGCIRSFIASLTPGEPIRMIREEEPASQVLEILPMGNRVALLRYSWTGQWRDSSYSLEILDRDGNTLHLEPLNYSQDEGRPIIRQLSKGTLAILHYSETGARLQLSIFSTDTLAMAPVAGLNLADVGPMSDFMKNANHPFFPLEEEDAWLFVLYFRTGYPATRRPILVRAHPVGGQWTLDAVADLQGGALPGTEFLVRLQDGILEWVGWGQDRSWLRFDRWNLAGEFQGTVEHPLPGGHWVDYVRSLPDGRLVLGGTAGYEEPWPWAPGPCEPLDQYNLRGALFAGALTPDGEIRISDHFYASGLFPVPWFFQPPLNSYAYARTRTTAPLSTLPPPVDEQLYVYGLYPHADRFCAPQENPEMHLGLPVESYGIYLVELALPAP